MKLKKIHKLLQKKLKLDYWILILIPVATLVGVITQISLLSKYNAVSLFSWNQVFNDSAIIFPLLLSLVMGYTVFGIYNKKRPGLIDISLSYFWIFFFGIITALITDKFLGNNYYVLGLFIFFIFGNIMGLMVYILDRFNSKSKLWNNVLPSLFYILIYSFVFMTFSLSYLMVEYINQSIRISINGSPYNKIDYINDKYIFYGNGKIIKTTDNYDIKIK